MSTLFLCGAGNSEGVRLALVVERSHHRWDRIVLLDDDPGKLGLTLLGVPVVAPIAELAHAATDDGTVNLVTRTCARRDAMHNKISRYGVPFATLIHPSVDTEGTTLAAGTTVYSGATIGPEVHVDTGSVVFMGGVVGHESQVGRGCVIAANAVLNARVRLGDRVYVGSNATIVPEVNVGADAVIGVGSAVLRDVLPGTTALGVPAELLQAVSTPLAAGFAGGATDARDDRACRELRRLVARAWGETLRTAEIGDDENFFDLGGTSLLACQVAEKTSALTGREVSLLDIFRFPTVGALADHLRSGMAGLGSSSPGIHRAQMRRLLHHHEMR